MSLIQDIEATIAHNNAVIEAERIRTKGEDTMTMKTKTYNGWTNYETWCVKLWMDDDKADSAAWDSQAEAWLEANLMDNSFTSAERQRVYGLVEDLKNRYLDQMPKLNGCYRDLLRSSLQSVNWYEIAEHLLADNAEILEVHA